MTIGDVLCRLVDLYILIVIGAIVLSYFQVPGDHPVARIRRLFRRAVDPLVVPLRRLVPPLRMGGMALDMSPIILILALRFIVSPLVCRLG